MGRRGKTRRTCFNEQNSNSHNVVHPPSDLEQPSALFLGVHVLDGLLTRNVRGGVGEVANLVQQISGNPNIEHQVNVDEVCVYLHEELFPDDGAYETTRGLSELHFGVEGGEI